MRWRSLGGLSALDRRRRRFAYALEQIKVTRIGVIGIVVKRSSNLLVVGWNILAIVNTGVAGAVTGAILMVIRATSSVICAPAPLPSSAQIGLLGVVSIVEYNGHGHAYSPRLPASGGLLLWLRRLFYQCHGRNKPPNG